MVKLDRLAAVSLMAAACGCGGGSGPVSGGTPGVPTLLDVQTQIFAPRCALSGCHIGTTAPFGLDLSSLSNSSANLVGVASGEMPSLLRVDPSDSANSYLYWKVSGNPGISGDPMPLSGAPLNAAELSLIAAWIDGGAN